MSTGRAGIRVVSAYGSASPFVTPLPPIVSPSVNEGYSRASRLVRETGVLRFDGILRGIDPFALTPSLSRPIYDHLSIGAEACIVPLGRADVPTFGRTFVRSLVRAFGRTGLSQVSSGYFVEDLSFR
jgi:hypothetical protein